MEGDNLNIQIFGTKKCNETKKAQRFKTSCKPAGDKNTNCEKWKTGNCWICTGYLEEVELTEGHFYEKNYKYNINQYVHGL